MQQKSNNNTNPLKWRSSTSAADSAMSALDKRSETALLLYFDSRISFKDER
ncbi:hypothetical protein [Bifidobacterium mongoliense]|uniref:hypothetical protein n=1 Tax=Bifidobacterium mongoliense TaxID=518643 RepID=UPI0030F45C8B